MVVCSVLTVPLTIVTPSIAVYTVPEKGGFFDADQQLQVAVQLLRTHIENLQPRRSREDSLLCRIPWLLSVCNDGANRPMGCPADVAL